MGILLSINMITRAKGHLCTQKESMVIVQKYKVTV